ncbi:anthranilate synthase component I [Lederbergia sp. NSJ-179]|uniref:anthranilate synthase component I n=1 Tax=Lederbergia sp. NSJ-179 TaxID=2931402 RepID=UPI001FD33965|nr:anthranilate synthase component I [Lederbergia sp. NSJ-179]MCJ7841093.1 anthranilate synthase component I [Lederbergia sp. NSJ-179]
MQTKQAQFKMKKLNGDVLTPINIFLRLEGKKKFLLESSLKHNEQGRYSFIGVNPILEFIGNGDHSQVLAADGHIIQTEIGQPLEALKKVLPRIELDLPFPFFGGAIGYVGYDAIRQYIPIGPILEDEIGMPDIHFMVYEDVIVFDHLAQSIYLLSIDFSGSSIEKELEERLQNLEVQITRKETDESLSDCNIQFTPKLKKEEFIRKVEEAKQYIQSGEVQQIVLSQRMTGEVGEDPFQFYRKLRNSNPSPYMFYVDFEPYIVLGASPESFVKTSGGTVTTNPIAGTRRRGKNDKEDEFMAKELLADEKELSEHRMLVDLSCRELAPICLENTVAVKDYMKLEYYRHVMHIVSEVEGTLKPDITGMDALISCLPAGTVSGDPKPRAMQIINELEKTKRGVYAGAIGYVNVNGDVDFAIAIRSLVIKDQIAYLQAGAGIVADSKPANEYKETINKAQALLSPKPY